MLVSPSFFLSALLLYMYMHPIYRDEMSMTECTWARTLESEALDAYFDG